MKIIGDNVLNVSLFGQRIYRQQARYYYQVVGYDCLVLVFHDGDYIDWNGREGIVLFDFDTIDGREICKAFPKAPGRWLEEPHLIQCTVRPGKTKLRHRRRTLSDAISHMIGDEC